MADETPAARDRDPDHDATAGAGPLDTPVRGIPRPRTTGATSTENPFHQGFFPHHPVFGGTTGLARPGHPGGAADDVHDGAAVTGVDLPLPAWQLRPGVEWGIVWADGRITVVASETVARMVTDRDSTCRVACRLVGAWGSP
jgi:hypothetical protein